MKVGGGPRLASEEMRASERPEGWAHQVEGACVWAGESAEVSGMRSTESLV